MDENEYRNAYRGINQQRCVFEKSILSLNCRCPYQEKFNLAEREGVRCQDDHAQKQCSVFLSHARKNARFALKLTDIVGDLLPHNKEIQVQKGALLGLAPELPNLADTPIDDIYQLINMALQQSGNHLEHFDYQKLMPSISHHPVRKRQRKHRKSP